MYLKQNAIRRIIHDLNNARLASPIARYLHIVEAEIANASRVDQWDDLGEVERRFRVRGASEAPFSDRMDVLNGDGEPVNLDIWSVWTDLGSEAAARRRGLFVFIEPGIWGPEEDEVGCCQAREEQR